MVVPAARAGVNTDPAAMAPAMGSTAASMPMARLRERRTFTSATSTSISLSAASRRTPSRNRVPSPDDEPLETAPHHTPVHIWSAQAAKCVCGRCLCDHKRAHSAGRRACPLNGRTIASIRSFPTRRVRHLARGTRYTASDPGFPVTLEVLATLTVVMDHEAKFRALFERADRRSSLMGAVDAIWALSWPEQRATGINPIIVRAFDSAGAHHPHLQGGPVGTWALTCSTRSRQRPSCPPCVP